MIKCAYSEVFQLLIQDLTLHVRTSYTNHKILSLNDKIHINLTENCRINPEVCSETGWETIKGEVEEADVRMDVKVDSSSLPLTTNEEERAGAEDVLAGCLRGPLQTARYGGFQNVCSTV